MLKPVLARVGARGLRLIVIWSGSIASIPTGWSLCDGTNGTPDLRDRFVKGASTDGPTGDLGATGGAWTAATTHDHTIPSSGFGAQYSDAESGHSHNTNDVASTETDVIAFNAVGSTPASLPHSHNVITTLTTATSHYHPIYGTSGQEILSVNVAPRYYALAYIQALDEVDIPVGAVTMTAGLAAALPAGYAVYTTLRHLFAMGRGSLYLPNRTVGSEYLTAANHTHEEGTIGAVGTGAHSHNQPNAYSQTTTAIEGPETAGLGLNSRASWDHTHKGTIDGTTVDGGTHDHTVPSTHNLPTSTAFGATYAQPPFYRLYYVRRVS